MMQRNNIHMPVFKKNWLWFLIGGIALIILGAIAINAAMMTTAVSVVMLGFLIFFCGAIIIADSYLSWWGRWSGFIWHLIVGLLYATVGYMLIQSPLYSSIPLTLLLGIFYVIVGIFRIGYASSFRLIKWQWSMFNGVISLLLGILILANWPASSLYIIGLFVGIDLIFAGWAYFMIGLSAKSLN